MAIKLAASIPPMTHMPITRREIAPAPLARARGTQPRMKAKDVMRIGRRRSFAPVRAASITGRPLSYSILANSTMRIAFFAARPMSMTRPIWA